MHITYSMRTKGEVHLHRSKFGAIFRSKLGGNNGDHLGN